MSSKSTIFLTQDNEHCYTDCNDPVYDENKKWVGDTLFLEIDEKNIVYQTADTNDGIIIGIRPGSDVYNLLKSIRQP